jgi:DNA-binding beta-propeller fold protein YncE
MTQSPGGFYYPNGIAFDAEGNVFVSDMNNPRVQLFTPLGEFKYLIRTSGSPLGLVIDPTQRLYVVDPFAHAVDIYELEGERITGFGGPGLTLGRFRFPSDIVLDATGRIFVSDRENDQVQVWGWPSGIVPPVEIPEEPEQWALCLSPLLLLLIPLLMRRKSFVATADFIDAMIASDAVAEMRNRRYRWLVMREVYAAYTGRESGGVYFDDILKASDYSRTDAEDLMEKTGIDLKTAGVLVLAERTGLLATQDAELAEAAAALGVRVVDREIYLAEYAARGGGATAGRAS